MAPRTDEDFKRQSTMTKKYDITVICSSCLTGKAVWVYRGPTRAAAVAAYRRACRHEENRLRSWEDRSRRRERNINALLNDCAAALQILGPLTQQQQQGINQLHNIAVSKYNCDMEFINHIRANGPKSKSWRIF